MGRQIKIIEGSRSHARGCYKLRTMKTASAVIEVTGLRVEREAVILESYRLAG